MLSPVRPTRPLATSERQFGMGSPNAPNRSTVCCGAGPAARILKPKPGLSPTAHRASRGEEAGVTGFDCGAGDVLLPTLRHRPGGYVPIWLTRRDLGPSSPRGSQPRDRKASKPMTRTKQDQAALRQGETARGNGARRLSLAIDARRHLGAPPADQTGPKVNRQVRAAPSRVRDSGARVRRPTGVVWRDTRSANAPS